jgi:hypothetical protein
MGTNSYNSLANFVILATISSSVLSLSYDSDSLIPKMNHNYNHQNNIADWKDNAFNLSSDYQIQNESLVKIQTIVEFSKKVLSNTKDIDSEYVDIVNENFWELI